MDQESEAIDPTLRCSTCEAVCCRLTVVLMPEDRVPIRFTDRDAAGLAIMAKGEEGWCAALDGRTMRCSIYALRPTVCRDFAMGGRSCAEERKGWYRHDGSAVSTALIEDFRHRRTPPAE